MTWVHIAVYLIAGAFIMLSVAMLLAYRRSGQYGMFMMGMTYGASGGLAIVLAHWWPLLLGYLLVWVLKALGLDPDKEVRQREREAAGAAEPPGSDKSGKG